MSLFYSYYKDDLVQFEALLKDDKDIGKAKSTKSKSSRIDPNAVDHLGRTILHIAATDGKHDFVEALLRNHTVDLEKQDRESGWTALHRALYAGSVSIAKLLLDYRKLRTTNRDLLSCVDLEANTAFDVYNSTILGVNPPTFDEDRGGSDLFTFGSNANHSLGFSDGDDRSFPERVNLKRFDPGATNSNSFRPQRIRDIVMAKYHTIVLTTDATDNIFTCGFAKNGRLGISGGTQFTFQPVPVPGQIVAAAAAQDHSLAVTKSGDLYAWGSNTHGQLGVDLEPNQQFLMQPRKVIKLSKETVLGVAASSTHSVCFTADGLYTWGTNDGALGYEVNPQEGKVVSQPRKVSSLTTSVKQVAATRFATTCLLDSDDVVVFTNYGFFKLSLQLDRFASQWQVFRPRQAYAPSKVVKVVSGTATIAVMTSMGDVFYFILDESTSSTKPATLAKSIKPNRVWSLRKKHMAIRDVDVGQEGTIIMCTESGLVYTGIRKNPKKSDSIKNEYKFSRVPGITRTIQVRASDGAAFGLIRDDVQLRPINLSATNLAEDLLCILPYSHLILEEEEDEIQAKAENGSEPNDQESDSDEVVPKHVINANHMLRNAQFSFDWDTDEDSYNLLFQLKGQILAVHLAICCARSSAIKSVLLGTSHIEGVQKVPSSTASPILKFDETNCDAGSLLIVVHWMYTDILLTPWIGCASRDQKRLLSMKDGARRLADLLQLKALSKALSGSFQATTKPSLANDMSLLITQPLDSGTADMRLLLADGEVLTHSVILAARSEFFGAMIAGAWISARRDDSSEAIVDINVKHISSRVMQIVLQHVFQDKDSGVFETVEVDDVEDFLDLVVSVMAAAAEFLLARLKEACQSVLARYIHRKNVVIILREADRYAADELKEGCLDYCARNLQFLMEKNLLDDLSDDLVAELELYIARKQIERLPISKSGSLLSELIQRNPDVLEASEVAKEKYLETLLTPMNVNPLYPKRPGSSSTKSKDILSSTRTMNSPKTLATSAEDIALIDDLKAFDLSNDDSVPWKLQQAETAITDTDGVLSTHMPSATSDIPVTLAAKTSIAAASPRGWQSAKSIATPAVDLRSALSESLKRTTPKKNPPEQSWTPVSNNKSNQKERRKNLSESPQTALSSSPGPSAAVPWALKTETPVTPLMTISQAQLSTSDKKVISAGTSTPPAMQVPKTVRRPSITPQASSANRGAGSYSGSYSQGLSPSPGLGSIGLSMGEIMAAEEAAKTKMVEYNAKRSMKEIQEQEAFERWFQEESRRVQKEEAEAAASAKRQQATGNNKKNTKKRGGKSKSQSKEDGSSISNQDPKSTHGRPEAKIASSNQGTRLHTNPEAAEFRPKNK